MHIPRHDVHPIAILPAHGVDRLDQQGLRLAPALALDVGARKVPTRHRRAGVVGAEGANRDGDDGLEDAHGFGAFVALAEHLAEVVDGPQRIGVFFAED